jgi:hypothetical protein
MTTKKRFCKVKGGYKDTTTKLVWGPYSNQIITWQAAQDWCAAQGEGWRLPTIEELITVVDYSYVNPATLLPYMLSAYYWSSSTSRGNPSDAWCVSFYDGLVGSDGKTFSSYARAVRGGS